MTRHIVGILDYGIGNHASLRHGLHAAGLRTRVADAPDQLESCDVFLLPGVGAFPPAMRALKAKGLDVFIREQARRRKPIIGVCLGMQLLTEGSQEGGQTDGIGLVPGEIVPLSNPRWHIGWNTINVTKADPVFDSSDGEAFYFNHAYTYKGPDTFTVCHAVAHLKIVAAVRRDRVVVVQFHPEKSQRAGRALVERLIDGLCNA